jgi:hypothetical protein
VPSIRDAIVVLHARCSFALDHGDGSAFAACFTEDGVLRTNIPREVIGREALAQFATERTSSKGHTTRHMTWNLLLDAAEGDRGSARCYVAVFHSGPHGADVMLTAEYHDRYQRTDGEWLIAERRVYIDGLPRR